MIKHQAKVMLVQTVTNVYYLGVCRNPVPNPDPADNALSGNIRIRRILQYPDHRNPEYSGFRNAPNPVPKSGITDIFKF